MALREFSCTATAPSAATTRTGLPTSAHVVAPIAMRLPGPPLRLPPPLRRPLIAGTIEILTSMTLLKAGERVPASAAALLGKLNIKPFAYGIELMKVYDGGDFYSAAVLDITDEDMEEAIGASIQNIAAVCLAANYPTLASVPHSIINAYKENVLALGVMLEEYTFPQAEKVKEILANPEAFAAAAAPAAGGGGDAPAAAAAPEPEESEDEDMGFDLFD